MDRQARGRTSAARLRALDEFLVHELSQLFTRTEGAWAAAPFIDVGFGERPTTTLEATEIFRRLHPTLPVLAFEREPHRVQNARALGDENVSFLLGGFGEVAARGPCARLIRVMNVLRSYREEEVPLIHEQLGLALLPGGLLVEGSSNPDGSILTAHLFERSLSDGLLHRGLLFYTSFAHGFAPLLFRDWLPRDLRRRTGPGTRVRRFFDAWTEAWQSLRRPETSPRALFAASAAPLVGQGEDVSLSPWLLEHGYLLWRPNVP